MLPTTAKPINCVACPPHPAVRASNIMLPSVKRLFVWRACGQRTSTPQPLHSPAPPWWLVAVSACQASKRRRRRRLLQVFIRDENHSCSSDAHYVTAMRSLLDWATNDNQPAPASVASQCADVAAGFKPQTGCRFCQSFNRSCSLVEYRHDELTPNNRRQVKKNDPLGNLNRSVPMQTE